ncbi:14018_t:CDS:2 [Acaulospora colombiana]|uniref:14018_t:CDS:1 n=1 Tax=Acaulospora colombiana TaxID=27376 RepID=A0ACA9MNH7_9GLOM|nr:14018_t:CDS:2 [Acaulospora colombiana]
MGEHFIPFMNNSVPLTEIRDPVTNKVHPPVTEKQKEWMKNFWEKHSDPANSLPDLQNLARLLKADGVQRIGVYGLCWGGRIATIAGANLGLDEGSAPLFDAVASIHPGIASHGDPQANKRITVDDIKRVTVPTALYASNGEPIDTYKELVEALDELLFSSKNAYRYYEKNAPWLGGSSS